MAGLLDRLSEESRALAKKTAQPDSVSPMLASLTEKRFSKSGWIFERKLDGERCICYRRRGKVRLVTRNGKEAGGSYPEIVEALEAVDADDFVADGEVVAFEGRLTSFSRLQHRMHVKSPSQSRIKRVPVFYYLFDLLYADGHDVRALPLSDRKVLLKALFDYEDPLRFSTHRNTSGEAFFREACRKGWEGLIAKRAESRYRSGRSDDWLKMKCVREQEFVIGGWTDPQASRVGFGALLVGYYDDGDLVYAGKVGTGFDDETLRDLHDRLAGDETSKSPFAGKDAPKSAVHWAKPRLVAEVAFTEWTGDGRLRHPRFLGLRRDKSPKDVVREGAS